MKHSAESNRSLTLSAPLRRESRASLVLCINGIVSKREDFVDMWREVRVEEADRFALVWEQKELCAITSALGSFITQQAVQQVRIMSCRLTEFGCVRCWPLIFGRC